MLISHKSKKSYGSVSGILFRAQGTTSVIYLGKASLPSSSNLPTGLNEQPFCCVATTAPAYLVLQPIRFTLLQCCHRSPWALTPRFHPYHAIGAWRLFSVALSVHAVSMAFPLGSMVLCVVPTFLYANGASTERPVATAKIQILCQRSMRFMMVQFCQIHCVLHIVA